MKAVRILQVIALLMLLGYFLLLHAANPILLNLPFLLPMPPVIVLGAALLIGWLIGWVPGRIAKWRRKREADRLRRRISELEQHVPSYDKEPVENTPVIPDRMPSDEERVSDRRSK